MFSREGDIMKCWHCRTELIWGGDHDGEDNEGCAQIETNLHCPHCQSRVYVLLPVEGPDAVKATPEDG